MDGRPNLKNKALFSNCPSVVQTVLTCVASSFTGLLWFSTQKTCRVVFTIYDHDTISASFQSPFSGGICCRRTNSLHSEYGPVYSRSIWNFNLVSRFRAWGILETEGEYTFLWLFSYPCHPDCSLKSMIGDWVPGMWFKRYQVSFYFTASCIR